ncbi:MAG TPA: multicopper oxidase domain-containing protein, partial [Chloroflexota bacterium]
VRATMLRYLSAARPLAMRTAFSAMMAAGTGLTSTLPSAAPVAASPQGTVDAGTCPTTAPVKRFNITAINVVMPLNRFGDNDPGAHMYALTSKIGNATAAGSIRYQEAMFNNPATQADSISLGLNGFPVQQADGSVKVIEDAIQPLAIRANGGDCVVIDFTNGIGSDNVGMHIDGLNFQMTSSGDAVGNNAPSGVGANAKATYTYYVPNDPALEGSHYIHPGPGNRGLVNHGLFGTLTVEAPGSVYYRADGTLVSDPTQDSGWERTIQPGPQAASQGWCNGFACPAFRENIKLHQDIGNESEPIRDRNNNALPTVDPHTHAYRPGSRGLNYRSEPFMDRLNLNPDQKSQTYGSYTFSDPATIIPRGYVGDPTKFRIVHAGSEVFHVYHLHGGAIRWRFNPRGDLNWDYGKTGLDKHPQIEGAQSWQLDAQSIGPGESYNLEIEGGAGSNQQGAGEFLFHCHIAEHYFSGMWGFWRVFDTLQPDLAPLPDRAPSQMVTSQSAQRMPLQAAVDSSQLIGKTFNGTTITQANLDDWIRPQLPPQGVKQRSVNTVGNGSFSQDGSVMDWVIDPATGIYLGEVENTTTWVDMPRLGNSSTAASGGGSSIPRLAGHPGSLIVDQFLTGANSNRPKLLFNLNNGRPSFPLLRAHIGDRPPFAPNMHSGAPYLGEQAGVNDASTPLPYRNRADSICPTEAVNGVAGAQIRRNNIVALPLVIPHTENAAKALAANPALGDPLVTSTTAALNQNIDQRGGVFVLAQDKTAVKSTEANPRGKPALGPDGVEKPIEPLALRANTGDCLFNTLVSEETDGNPELPYAKANIHIHHVQFDTQASDGVISGFSYEQSVRPYKIEDTQLTAEANVGDTVLHVASVAKYLNPNGSQRVKQSVAIGQGLNTIEMRRVLNADPVALTLTLDSPLQNVHAVAEYAGNEFVQYMWFPDVALDNIFFHDHVNGVFGWSHGFVGQLVIEPRGSTYHDPKTGNEIKSGTQADIWAGSPLAAGQVDGSYREQVLWTIDNHSTDAGGKVFFPAENSINLRSEPWVDRLADNADPSLLFSSWTHGDPYTPMPRAYVGDNVVIRAINVSQNVNNFQIDGHRFNIDPRLTGQTSTITDPQTGTAKVVASGPNISAKTDAYHAGISERVTLFLEGGAGGLQKRGGDYLYHDGLGTAFRNGAWGLIRVLDGADPNDTLQPLPGTVAPTVAATTVGSRTRARPPATTDWGNPCPAAAPMHRFAVTAVRVKNGPVGGQLAFVPNSQAAAVTAGTLSPEPLALHVANGECVEVLLTNDANSGLANIGLNLGKLVSDPRSSGINMGYTSEQSVASGQSRVYRYYADSDHMGSAVIAGFGGAALAADALSADAGRSGLYGALTVSPAGSTFSDPQSGAPKDIGTQVDVRLPGGKSYRDFTLIAMETDEHIGTSHMPYPISVSGPALINYQSAQGWNQNPRPDDANTFSSLVNGDPRTPVLQGYAGDPTRIHVVGAPGSEQMHVFSFGGLSFPLDPYVGEYGKNPNWGVKLQNRAVGAYETIDANIDGGMGGGSYKDGNGKPVVGDFVYQDRRLPYTQAGMWGLIRSLDPNLCTSLKALDGYPCGGTTTPGNGTTAPGTPGAFGQPLFPTGTKITINTPIDKSTMPVTVTWAAASGMVNHYELQQAVSTSTNGLTFGAFSPFTSVASPTTTNATLDLQLGKLSLAGIVVNKYQFQVRACASSDSSLCSAFSPVSKAFTLLPVDDTILSPIFSGGGQVSYSGKWQTKTATGPNGYYGGSTRYSTSSGANALLQGVTFSVTGDVAWISALGPQM